MPFKVQELIDREDVGKVKIFVVRAEFAWPEERVENQIVFAHKVVVPSALIVPEILEGRGVGFPFRFRPLRRGGKIADNRFEPDVDSFIFYVVNFLVVGDLVNRELHSPIKVASDGAGP